jgi:hypothetical protein
MRKITINTLATAGILIGTIGAATTAYADYSYDGTDAFAFCLRKSYLFN